MSREQLICPICHYYFYPLSQAAWIERGRQRVCFSCERTILDDASFEIACKAYAGYLHSLSHAVSE